MQINSSEPAEVPPAVLHIRILGKPVWNHSPRFVPTPLPRHSKWQGLVFAFQTPLSGLSSYYFHLPENKKFHLIQ